MQRMSRAWVLSVAVLLAVSSAARAENGAAGWLRYERITDTAVRQRYEILAGSIAALDTSAVVSSARDELIRGVRSMLDRGLTTTSTPADAAIVIGTVDEVRRALPSTALPALTKAGAFWIGTTTGTRQ